jgi:salicylate hydroxylase
VDELERWYNDEATVAFLGDACHPMLPYMAQGAGSAIEDGAALGIILSKVKSRQELPDALKAYQNLRVPRSTALQKWSMKQVRLVFGRGFNYKMEDQGLRLTFGAETYQPFV